METLKFSTKPLRKPHFHNYFWVPQNSRILGVYNKKGRTFSFTLTSKLKTSKWKKISKKRIVPGKISLKDSGGAPPLLERKKAAEATTKNNDHRPKRDLLGGLLNFPLPIGEIFVVAGLMALGTVIDQGELPEFVIQNYLGDDPLLGFFSWKWIFTLGLDHMFSSPIFLGTLALLGASLMARTYTTQTPLVKVATRQSFSNSAEAIHKQEDVDTLPRASVKDSGVKPMGAGYEIFLKVPALHALKGLAGRFASIGVHLALLLLMSGGTLDEAGSLGGDVTVPQGLNSVGGDVTVPQGLNSVVGDVLAPSGVQSSPSDAVVGDESGEVSQFHTDISLFDLDGEEVLRKTIIANDPLRSTLAHDLQSIILYDKEGKFAGVRWPNSNLLIENIDGTKIVITDAIGSRGLDLKSDQGVPIVYAGFCSLMLSSCISYLSHAKLSALKDGKTVVVGGKTNRAKGESPDTTDSSADQVPEVFESSSTEESDSFIGFRIQVGIWNKNDFDM